MVGDQEFQTFTTLVQKFVKIAAFLTYSFGVPVVNSVFMDRLAPRPAFLDHLICRLSHDVTGSGRHAILSVHLDIAGCFMSHVLTELQIIQNGLNSKVKIIVEPVATKFVQKIPV